MSGTKSINPRRNVAIILLVIIALYFFVILGVWNRPVTQTEMLVSVVLGAFGVFALITSKAREKPDK